MQLHISPGKALCRFCGRQISMNRLSTHILKEHPRPEKVDLSPTLVRTRTVKAGSGPARRTPGLTP